MSDTSEATTIAFSIASLTIVTFVYILFVSTPFVYFQVGIKVAVEDPLTNMQKHVCRAFSTYVVKPAGDKKV